MNQQTSHIIAFVLDATPITYEERRTNPKMIPIYETDTIDLDNLEVVGFKRVNSTRIPIYESVYLQYDDDVRPCSFRYLYQGIANDDNEQFNYDDYC